MTYEQWLLQSLQGLLSNYACDDDLREDAKHFGLDPDEAIRLHGVFVAKLPQFVRRAVGNRKESKEEEIRSGNDSQKQPGDTGRV